jgi:hypothetical protein
MSIRCSDPDEGDCEPICKSMDDVRGTVSNATYANALYYGWEAGPLGAPGLIVIQEWCVSVGD